MNRRTFLQKTCLVAGIAGSSSVPVGARSDQRSPPPGVAWRRDFETLAVRDAIRAHGGGFLLVGLTRDNAGHPDPPVRVAVIDPDGSVRRSREVRPDVSGSADRLDLALPAATRTENGYAIAAGTWLALLDRDLTVTHQGTAPAADWSLHNSTSVVETANGFFVATIVNRPDNYWTLVFGFDSTGEHQWTHTYDRMEAAWLCFLEQYGDGVVVGFTRSGGLGLVTIGPDGTERRNSTVDAIPGFPPAAVDDDGVVVFGEGELVRLDREHRVTWRRSLDQSVGGYPVSLSRTSDGGFVLLADNEDRYVTVAKTDPDGRLEWSDRYAATTDDVELLDPSEVPEGGTRGIIIDSMAAVESPPGEILTVGQQRRDFSSWGFLVSDGTERRPITPTRTPTQTTTRTTTTGTTVESRTTGDGETTPGSPVPGFGIGAALVGTAAGLIAKRRP
ncbi:hypothetical protein [Haloarchaeobius sp. HRN-SO-5]|uniref:hypothetical protein n=1 Tax=Haloarchaeobius sp. HRN-SO-5 TaxID=3446118 RepID=UPI003EBCA7E2